MRNRSTQDVSLKALTTSSADLAGPSTALEDDPIAGRGSRSSGPRFISELRLA
jgi:hypothetical protein